MGSLWGVGEGVRVCEGGGGRGGWGELLLLGEGGVRVVCCFGEGGLGWVGWDDGVEGVVGVVVREVVVVVGAAALVLGAAAEGAGEVGGEVLAEGAGWGDLGGTVVGVD